MVELEAAEKMLFACRITKARIHTHTHTHTHTLIIFILHYFSTTIMVTRTHLSVTLQYFVLLNVRPGGT